MDIVDRPMAQTVKLAGSFKPSWIIGMQVFGANVTVNVSMKEVSGKKRTVFKGQVRVGIIVDYSRDYTVVNGV